MIIQSVQQTYVFNQTQGAVTEPVNGNWLQAYCEYLGITEPVNSSWLQALCNNFGITEPLYGSWTIALANYYGITQPVNGTWWYALSQDPGVITYPPTADFTSDVTTITEGGTVNFTDTSTVDPLGPAITNWGWTFAGGTPNTSTLQNPPIVFNTAGSYEVSLTVTNADGFNTKTVLDYMTVEAQTLDPDAAAYLTATNTISDATISDAVNQLVLDLKAAGVWSKLDGAYPFAGSTATQHGYNLLDPQNTNAAYYLTWAGGWTHTLDGPKGNGSNTFADTHWPTLSYADGTHLSVYNTVASGYFTYDVGNTGPDWALIVAYQAGRSYYKAGAGGYLNVPGNSDTGFAGASSNGTNNGGNLRYLHRDGSQVAQDTTGSVTLSTSNLVFGAANLTPAAPSNGEYTWLSFGSEFINNTEMTAMYNAVETYKIAMSR